MPELPSQAAGNSCASGHYKQMSHAVPKQKLPSTDSEHRHPLVKFISEFIVHFLQKMAS